MRLKKKMSRFFRKKQKNVTPPDWHSPQVACSLLDELQMTTTGYKCRNEFKPEQYSCFSSYKETGGSSPMPNNLVYYATGDRNTVKELELVLNVNDPADAEESHRALGIAAGLLIGKALGKNLINEVLAALLTGQSGGWYASGNEMGVLRDEWGPSKGYEVRFFLRTPQKQQVTIT